MAVIVYETNTGRIVSVISSSMYSEDLEPLSESLEIMAEVESHETLDEIFSRWDTLMNEVRNDG